MALGGPLLTVFCFTEETTQPGRISEEPLAVIAQKMTGVSTISAVSKIT